MAASSPLRHHTRQFLNIPLTLSLAFAFCATLGCGSGGGSANSKPQFSGSTSVTVLLSSKANAQLQSFGIGLTGITLTNQSGQTVTVMSAPLGTQQWAEFIHVNGGADPFLTVSVPQGIYTAAAVTVGDSAFTCVTLTPGGGLDTSTFAYGFTPTNAPPTTVTVNLASPITITGDSMGLSLDLLVSQSATYSECYDPNGSYTYAITPTFDLTGVALSAQPTSPQNGKVPMLEGEVTALGTGANTFTLTLPQGPRTFSIKADSHTLYQGIGDFSGLTVGTFVDMDGAVQPDGSLLATRIAVEDPSAVDIQIGPGMVVGGDPLNGETSAWFFNRISQGQDRMSIVWPYNIHDAVFQISGQLTNLQTLPFVPAFNVSNLVAGQNVYVSSQVFLRSSDPYTPAVTLTLMPQTINGTVVGSAQIGSFTDYTVALAPYDFFPLLAVQQGQTTLLTNPSQMEIYVDSSTQLLGKMAPTVGQTFRFRGLVFNDGGTLRMDCGQVYDGVAFSLQATSSKRMQVGQGRSVYRKGPGKVTQTTTYITTTR